MVIKASAASEIRSLVAALDDPDDVRREAAIARLGVIGARVVDRLLAAYPAAAPATRSAILRALEPIDDPRVLDLARRAVEESPTADAAAATLRRLMDSSSGRTASEALDALVSAAVGPVAAPATRRAAREALRDAPADVAVRLTGATDAPDTSAGAAASPRTPHAAAARRPGRRGAASDPNAAAATALWDALAAGRLTGGPDRWLPALASRTPPPLAALQRLVDAVRALEEQGGDDDGAWRALRGRAHHALAVRGSRIALYDLRESLAAASRPLPVSFLAAVQEAGDVSCLEPLARAWSQADPSEEWWRQQLAAAFRAIMRREKLTKRSAAVKKVRAKWPDANLY